MCIMTNARHTILYAGVTNDLRRRVLEHRAGKPETFAGRYRTTQLVYFECGEDVRTAIAKE